MPTQTLEAPTEAELQLLRFLVPAAVQHNLHGPALKALRDYVVLARDHRMSERITYATDQWGNVPGSTHLEIKWRGGALFVDITEEKIDVVGHMPFDVDKRSSNAFSMTSSCPIFVPKPA